MTLPREHPKHFLTIALSEEFFAERVLLSSGRFLVREHRTGSLDKRSQS